MPSSQYSQWGSPAPIQSNQYGEFGPDLRSDGWITDASETDGGLGLGKRPPHANVRIGGGDQQLAKDGSNIGGGGGGGLGGVKRREGSRRSMASTADVERMSDWLDSEMAVVLNGGRGGGGGGGGVGGGGGHWNTRSGERSRGGDRESERDREQMNQRLDLHNMASGHARHDVGDSSGVHAGRRGNALTPRLSRYDDTRTCTRTYAIPPPLPFPLLHTHNTCVCACISFSPTHTHPHFLSYTHHFG